MLFNERLAEKTEKLFQDRMGYLGFLKEEIHSGIESLSSADEQLALKYLIGTLPVSDMIDYPLSFFINTIKTTLPLRENIEYCKNLEPQFFLDYILCPRVNNEQLSDYRAVFYNTFYNSKLENKSVEEKVIDANYRCLKYVTYQSTDDRTSSALSIFNRGYGRCGEESVFTVSVLRSIGIAARQVYAPFWAHCDDNHAWVEIWDGGQWRYLGACEPEMVLDRGWFTSAASRAMLIHARIFGDNCHGEDLICKEGSVSVVNLTKRYANTKKNTITVLRKGNPCENAEITLSLINYGKIAPIARLQSNNLGQAHIETGLGSLIVSVSCDGLYSEILMDTRNQDSIIINLEEQQILGNEFDFCAPEDGGREKIKLSQEQLDIHKALFAENAQFRIDRDENFMQGLPDNDALKSAKHQAGAIAEFLESEIPFKNDLLDCLLTKDYTDIDFNILKSHDEQALKYKDTVDRDIFNSYILSPRIGFENITDYRGFIENYFENKAEAFRQNPKKIRECVHQLVKYIPEIDYHELYTSPKGALLSGLANPKSMDILIVAVSRTFGIPARLNPMTKKPEYYKDGVFKSFNETQKGNAVSISVSGSEEWVYGTNWSIGTFTNEGFNPLEMQASTSPEELQNFSFEKGRYRLITANRLPNGNTYCNKYDFDTSETSKLTIGLRAFDLDDMLIDIKVNDFNVTSLKGEMLSLSSSLEKKWNLIVWLCVAEEPTEHILNELMENKELFLQSNLGITFIMKDREELQNKTVKKVLAELPFIKTVFDMGFENHEMTARGIYVDPSSFPLAMITDNSLRAVYGFSGYRVGLAELLFKVLKHKEQAQEQA